MSADGTMAVPGAGDSRDARSGAAAGVPRLAFEAVAGGYGGAHVVRGISGAVASGEVLCVIGRNGVGKSTLLKLLTGQLRLASGRVRLDGRAIEHVEASRRRALGMAYCPQERPVFDDLSVRDNLTLLRADRRTARFEPYFARFPILARRLAQHAGTLAGGEKKILSFVRGLSEGAPLLLLDEPSEGVQWENILHMVELLQAARSHGASFVVVEQNLAFAERIADRYLVVEQGRAALEGRRDEIDRARLLSHLHV